MSEFEKKKERRRTRNEEKRKNQKKVEEKERKTKNTCLQKDCKRVRNKGKNWFVCSKCEGVLCLTHRKWLLQHTLKVHFISK
jgi:hypothetical protein